MNSVRWIVLVMVAIAVVNIAYGEEENPKPRMKMTLEDPAADGEDNLQRRVTISFKDKKFMPALFELLNACGENWMRFGGKTFKPTPNATVTYDAKDEKAADVLIEISRQAGLEAKVGKIVAMKPIAGRKPVTRTIDEREKLQKELDKVEKVSFDLTALFKGVGGDDYWPAKTKLEEALQLAFGPITIEKKASKVTGVVEMHLRDKKLYQGLIDSLVARKTVGAKRKGRSFYVFDQAGKQKLNRRDLRKEFLEEDKELSSHIEDDLDDENNRGLTVIDYGDLLILFAYESTAQKIAAKVDEQPKAAEKTKAKAKEKVPTAEETEKALHKAGW